MGNLAWVGDELLAVDPRDLPSVALGEEIVEISRQLSRLQAAYLDRVEAFDRTGAAFAEHGSTAVWLRAKTRATPSASYRGVRLARDLADVMPATRAALRDGAINRPRPSGAPRCARRSVTTRCAPPNRISWTTRPGSPPKS